MKIFAVEKDGVVNLRTAYPTKLGVMVNAIAIIGNVTPKANWTDADVKSAFKILEDKRGVKLVEAEIVNVKKADY